MCIRDSTRNVVAEAPSFQSEVHHSSCCAVAGLSGGVRSRRRAGLCLHGLDPAELDRGRG